MRMMFVVMTERHRQIHHRCLAVRFRHDADVVPFYRHHEAFCYAIAFRASHCCRTRLQSQQPGERRHCWQLPSEAFFHRTQHDILHRFFVIASGARCPVNDLLSQQSCAKVTRSFSPLSQRNSKPSEHQRRLLSATATRPYGPAYGKDQRVYVQEADYAFS